MDVSATRAVRVEGCPHGGRRHDCHHATMDYEHLAGDAGRGGAGQVGDQRSHVVGRERIVRGVGGRSHQGRLSSSVRARGQMALASTP